VFKEFLDNHSNDEPELLQYFRDLETHIEKAISDRRPLYAVHGFCTDGGVSGAMIHFADPEGVIVPINYAILNDKLAAEILANIEWKGIVDLKPFNNKTVEFWVDHHLSVLNHNVNAKKIRFDMDGDSGAYQLLLSSFLGEFPLHLVELATMTRTTDTAGYIIQPPISQFSKLDELIITETEGIEGRKQEEERIWLLDDAWNTVSTLKDHLVLMDRLAKHGFMGLDKLLPKINQLRERRKKAYEIADSIKVDRDVIVFSYIDQDKLTITRRLQFNGAKVVISLGIIPNGVKISLRRNRELSEDLNQQIQLNELAILMNGGGHAGASGGFTSTIDEALYVVKKWAVDKKLSWKLVELD
jgi:hypothetical protein